MPCRGLPLLLALLAGTLTSAEPEPPLNLVEQAAAALAAGREQEAAELLGRHVEENPREIIVRAQLAELWYRQHRLSQARYHFATFLLLADQQPDIAFRYRIHAHSRLVEIAGKLDLPFDEHFHRGLGLWLLAERRATEPDPSGEFSVNELLVRAAKELQAARRLKPAEARPHYYLAKVWRQLGQPSACAKSLRAADRLALTSLLTPAEQRDLHSRLLELGR